MLPNNQKKPSSKKVDNSSSAGGLEAFKLYISPSAAISNSTLRFSEIEQKLSKLENLIGINEQTSSSGLDSKSLLGSLDQLSNRFKLLEQQNLEYIDVKLSNVLTRLNAINEKKDDY